MKNYTLEVVVGRPQIREFLDLPKRLYKGNRYWVCPFDMDVEKAFDPEKNEYYDNGDYIRWLARDSKGQVVGRIAAFYNEDIAKLNEQPTGGCGFFESINDQKVANLLFDAARDWLEERGMEAMDGPVNPGDRDQWWGLLVDGFEMQPVYLSNYNPPYYKEMFEEYGFKNYFNQHSYVRKLEVGSLSPGVYDRVKRLQETPGYRFAHIEKSNLQQAADDFRRVYNKAWAGFQGVTPMDKEHTDKLMNTLKPIMDEKLIYFAYFNNEPIGFFVMIPDLNRIIHPFHGKMNVINGLRMLFKLRFSKKNNRAVGIIFGVVPEFQGKGVESGMMYAMEEELAAGNIKYKTLELMWIGDFNPLMMRVAENYVCAKRHKRYVTYRYLFDREKPFTRCPRLGIRRDI